MTAGGPRSTRKKPQHHEMVNPFPHRPLFVLRLKLLKQVWRNGFNAGQNDEIHPPVQLPPGSQQVMFSPAGPAIPGRRYVLGISANPEQCTLGAFSTQY